MIKNYNSFLYGPLLEANIKNSIKRSDLKVGDEIMTQGQFDNVLLDYQTGKIIDMKEYGYILVEFDKSFSDKLHAGIRDIGKPGHCFYIPIDNISSNNKKEFEKILKKVGEEKKNKADRLNAEYKEGDIIVGVGKIKAYNNMDIDGEIGIVYYQMGGKSIEWSEKSPNNKTYWIGFLDKKNYMRADYDGMPRNGAGIQLDKLYIRHATPEEIKKFQDKIKPFLKDIDDIKKQFKEGDVVVGKGTLNKGSYQEMKLDGEIGVIRYVQSGSGMGRKQYFVQFLKNFSEYLYDVNYVMGGPFGYIIGKIYLIEPTEKQLEDNKSAIDALKKDIEEFNHDYKKGDYVITKGIDMNSGVVLDGQIGIIKEITGTKPNDQFTVQFLAKFSENLYKVGRHENSYRIHRRNLSAPKDIDIEELKRKLEANEIAPYLSTQILSMLMARTEIKLKVAFLTNSYFDVVKDINDQISYLPLKRWDGKEDPYKSRFRQQIKIGKFFRILNPDVTQTEIEKSINAFKSAYDIVVKGASDKLRLVSGEAMRFWYCGDNYVKGGGTLNSSCMQAKSKGAEMQMFVDNPDVIQILILTDDNNKLLGRANVWRLADPPGKTYMEYVYSRYDKDVQLFLAYAHQRGWYTGDGPRGRFGGGGGKIPNTMVCALTSGKKYRQGRDALDHFDTLRLSNDGTYLYRGNASNWKRPEKLVIAREDGDITIEKSEESLKEGDKVIYKNPGKELDNKKGTYYGKKDNGKFKILFDDGTKLACHAKNIHKIEEKEDKIGDRNI